MADLDQSRREIAQEIELLERKLAARRQALALLEGADGEPLPAHLRRFEKMLPKDAFRIILHESGKPLTRERLTRVLEEGGGFLRKKKKGVNAHVSFNVNIKLGNLVEVDGFIGLPEWYDRKAKHWKPGFEPGK